MNCKFKIFKYLGILAFFAIIMANYFCLYDKVVDELKYKSKGELTSYMPSNSKQDQFSRIDSLEQVVSKIDSEYNSSIDLMINKLNTWLGFWLAIITIVLLIVTFWQYLKIEKYDERVEKLEKYIKEKQNKNDARVEEMVQKLKDWDKIAQVKTTMLSSMLNLTNITDPMLLSNSSDRKSQQIYYMRMLGESFNKYIKMIEGKYLVHQLNEEIISQIPMLLLNFRIAMVKCQGTFVVNPRLILKYYELLIDLKSTEKEVRQSQNIENVAMRHLNLLVSKYNAFCEESSNYL